MRFTSALVLVIIAAGCAHASAVYGGGRRVPPPERSYRGPPRVGVLPVRDNSYVDAKLAKAARAEKYDARRLVHDTVYNPRRVEVNTGRFGNVGVPVDSFGRGLGGESGFMGRRPRSCNDCRVGEECSVSVDRAGRPLYTCMPVPFSPRRGSRLGPLPRQPLARNRCVSLTFPERCESRSTRRRFTTTLYAYENGHCHAFTASTTVNGCRPNPRSNIFPSMYECESYCGF